MNDEQIKEVMRLVGDAVVTNLLFATEQIAATPLLDKIDKISAERDALAAELQKAKGDRDIWAAEHERQIEEKRALAAELKALREQEPVLVQHRKPIGDMQGATVGHSEWKDGSGLKWWPHRHLYAHPVPAREMTDADIALCIASADKSFAQDRISGKPVLGVWSKHLARAIERYLKGEGK